MARSKRPAVVTVLGVLGIISGVSQVISGMFVALDGDRVNDFSNTGLTDSGLIWLGVTTMAFGAFSLFLASSIMSGQTWARVWYSVVATLNIVLGLWLVISHNGEARWTGLMSAVIWVVVLQLLYNNKSEAYFDN